jgi:hypothetical protein
MLPRDGAGVGFVVAATVGLLAAVFGFTTAFLTATGDGVVTTLALPGVEPGSFDLVLLTDFFAGFLAALFATAAFLTVFLVVFLAAFFTVFFAVFFEGFFEVFLAAFFAPRLLVFARFFTADTFAVVARVDLPAFFAPRFLTVFFLGVATTNSFMLKPDC